MDYIYTIVLYKPKFAIFHKAINFALNSTNTKSNSIYLVLVLFLVIISHAYDLLLLLQNSTTVVVYFIIFSTLSLLLVFNTFVLKYHHYLGAETVLKNCVISKIITLLICQTRNCKLRLLTNSKLE